MFLYSPIETRPILQNAASKLEVVWNRRGMSSQLKLEKVRRETGGDEPSSDQMIFPLTGTKMAGVWRGRGLQWQCLLSLTNKKRLGVMSQWAHITRNWECT
jgi:hypothetical protein